MERHFKFYYVYEISSQFFFDLVEILFAVCLNSHNLIQNHFHLFLRVCLMIFTIAISAIPPQCFPAPSAAEALNPDDVALTFS